MKFNPKPGDKIICNNGDEFICCTLGNLKSKGAASYLDDEVSIIFGISEHWEKNYSWMYWQGNNYPTHPEWNIREVIPQSVEAPADKKEEVKEEPLYTMQEIKEAWDASGWFSSTMSWNTFKKNLTKVNSPEYQEYLRLRAIYE